MVVEPTVRQNSTFADKVRQRPTRPPIYTGEDEVDEYDEVDLSFIYNLNTESTPTEDHLADDRDFNVPNEIYKEALIPWKRVVFLKLLGKNISLKVLKSRLESLWNLRWGCELVDLEGGFFVARFRCPEDYRYVLENGP